MIMFISTYIGILLIHFDKHSKNFGCLNPSNPKGKPVGQGIIMFSKTITFIDGIHQ